MYIYIYILYILYIFINNNNNNNSNNNNNDVVSSNLVRKSAQLLLRTRVLAYNTVNDEKPLI